MESANNVASSTTCGSDGISPEFNKSINASKGFSALASSEEGVDFNKGDGAESGGDGEGSAKAKSEGVGFLRLCRRFFLFFFTFGRGGRRLRE